MSVSYIAQDPSKCPTEADHTWSPRIRICRKCKTFGGGEPDNDILVREVGTDDTAPEAVVRGFLNAFPISLEVANHAASAYRALEELVRQRDDALRRLSEK